MPSRPVYLGRNNLDLSARFAIDGKRWDYTFWHLAHLDTTEYLARRVSAGKAFAYAKRYGQATAIIRDEASQ